MNISHPTVIGSNNQLTTIITKIWIYIFIRPSSLLRDSSICKIGKDC
jgi:hypothetical protein